MACLIFVHTPTMFWRSFSQSTPARSSMVPSRLLSPRMNEMKSSITRASNRKTAKKASAFPWPSPIARASFVKPVMAAPIFLRFIATSMAVNAAARTDSTRCEPPSLSVRSVSFWSQSRIIVRPFAPMPRIF